MKNDVLQKVAEYGKAHRNRKRWFRIFACLAAVVVFCTTYALILPAITLERAHCEIPEHVHTEECYTKVASIAKTEPICTIESLKIHEHKEDCYDEEGRLVCGYADFVVHQHDTSCYRADGTLWCPLPEIEEHEHDDSCYAWDDSEKAAGNFNAEEDLFLGKALKHVGKVTETGSGHVHNEDCYTLQRGGRICTETGDAGHIHDENCYTEKEVLVCDLEESEGHRHDDGCYEMEEALVCDLEEQEGSEHVHTDECYEWDEVLTCGLSEQSSEYSDSLEENEIVEDSDFEESGESVTDREPEEESIPTESESSSEESSEEETRQEESFEAETEEERAGEPVFICEKEEIILHEHTEECFDEDGNLICGEIQVLEHVHTADCFHTVETACDPDELTCQIPESEEHHHTALCYGTWELTCGMAEHVHDENCKSAGLTAEEQAQVEEMIALIDALPDDAAVKDTLAAYEEAGQKSAYQSYRSEVRKCSLEVFEKYNALTELQKEKITNLEKLMALSWLWEDTESERYAPLTEDDALVYELTLKDSTVISDSGMEAVRPMTVRNHEKIRTEFSVNIRTYSDSSYGEGRVKLEFVLPLPSEQAVFDMEEMQWLDESEGYEPEVTTEDRLFGEEEISCQILTGYKHLISEDGSAVISGDFTEDVVIAVENAVLGDSFPLQVSAAMEYSEWDTTCEEHQTEEKRTVTSEAFTVIQAFTAEEMQQIYEQFIEEVQSLEALEELDEEILFLQKNY